MTKKPVYFYACLSLAVCLGMIIRTIWLYDGLRVHQGIIAHVMAFIVTNMAYMIYYLFVNSKSD